MTTRTLSAVTVGISLAVIVGWGIFWGLQVISAIELIELSNAPL